MPNIGPIELLFIVIIVVIIILVVLGILVAALRLARRR